MDINEDCEVCNGRGKIEDVLIQKDRMCNKCLGTGKLDWIEKIIGKNINEDLNEFIELVSNNIRSSLDQFILAIDNDATKNNMMKVLRTKISKMRDVVNFDVIFKDGKILAMLDVERPTKDVIHIDYTINFK